MARKTRLTKELQDRIVARVRQGNYLEPAARSCGVAHSSLYLWIDFAKQGRRPYVDFVDAVDAARAEAEVEVVAQLHSAIPTSWRAGFRWLESHAPSRWGRLGNVSGAQAQDPNQLHQAEPSQSTGLDRISEFLHRHPGSIPAVVGALRSIQDEMRRVEGGLAAPGEIAN